MPIRFTTGNKGTVDGVYRVEFENPDGLLLDGGLMVLESGRFEGGMANCHYAGKFATETDNRFRAEGVVSSPKAPVQKPFGIFGDDSAQFDMIMIGHVQDGHVRGLLVRVEHPYAAMRFQLTRNPTAF